MPPLADVVDVVRVRLGFTLEPVTVESTFHMSYSGGEPSAANVASYAALVRAQAGDNFDSLLASAYSIGPVTVTDLSSDSGAVGTDTTAVDGTANGTLLPIATCADVVHTIQRRYRGGRPRQYLPLGTETNLQTNKTWTTAFVDAVDTAWHSFIGAISGVTEGTTLFVTLVNVSYFDGATWEPVGTSGRTKRVPTPRATPLVDVVTSTATNPILGSQRRRNRSA
jgi:hypothetical protein